MKLCSRVGTTITLQRLLPNIQVFGDGEVEVAACHSQPSRIRPGDLFVLLHPPGPRREAAVEQAVRRGCAAILSEDILVGVNVPVICVSDVRTAYGHICQALHGFPAQKLSVIGVAGSYGKTTTACLVARILVQAGHSVGMLTSLGYFEGEESTFPPETTPGPEDLALRLARMLDNGCTHAVVEVSGKAIKQQYLAGLELNTVVFLNDDVNAVYSGSGRVNWFSLLNDLRAEGLAIFNADDSRCRAALAETNHPALTVGVQSAAEIKAKEIRRHLGEEIFYICLGDESFPVRTRMFGRHHIRNCLAAAAVGLAYQVPMEVIVQALESVDQLPGRLQPVLAGQPFSVFVDAAETPQALAVVLQAVRPQVEGRLICVASLPRSPRHELTKWLELLHQECDLAVLTLNDPGREDPAIFSTFSVETKKVLQRITLPDRAEAIGWALTQAKEKDCVLIVGNGHRQWRPVKGNDLEVDDYQFTRQWLRQEFPHWSLLDQTE
ncbi:MAG: Mur ligase family protein [Thermogutta sp.]